MAFVDGLVGLQAKELRRWSKALQIDISQKRGAMATQKQLQQLHMAEAKVS